MLPISLVHGSVVVVDIVVVVAVNVVVEVDESIDEVVVAKVSNALVVVLFVVVHVLSDEANTAVATPAAVTMLTRAMPINRIFVNATFPAPSEQHEHLDLLMRKVRMAPKQKLIARSMGLL